MNLFVAIISRNRERSASTLYRHISSLSDKISARVSHISIVSHVTPYEPYLWAAPRECLPFVHSYVETPNVSLGFLRNKAITQGMINEADYVLVLDDDNVLYDHLESWEYVLSKLQADRPHMLQLDHKNKPGEKITYLDKQVVTTSGGVFIDLTAYTSVGGFGDDYYDLPELCLKMRSRGLHNMKVISAGISGHMYQQKGGLKDIYPEKKSCNDMRHLSRICENFPELVQRDDNSFLGFRLL